MSKKKVNKMLLSTPTLVEELFEYEAKTPQELSAAVDFYTKNGWVCERLSTKDQKIKDGYQRKYTLSKMGITSKTRKSILYLIAPTKPNKLCLDTLGFDTWIFEMSQKYTPKAWVPVEDQQEHVLYHTYDKARVCTNGEVFECRRSHKTLTNTQELVVFVENNLFYSTLGVFAINEFLNKIDKPTTFWFTETKLQPSGLYAHLLNKGFQSIQLYDGNITPGPYELWNDIDKDLAVTSCFFQVNGHKVSIFPLKRLVGEINLDKYSTPQDKLTFLQKSFDELKAIQIGFANIYETPTMGEQERETYEKRETKPLLGRSKGATSVWNKLIREFCPIVPQMFFDMNVHTTLFENSEAWRNVKKYKYDIGGFNYARVGTYKNVVQIDLNKMHGSCWKHLAIPTNRFTEYFEKEDFERVLKKSKFETFYIVRVTDVEIKDQKLPLFKRGKYPVNEIVPLNMWDFEILRDKTFCSFSYKLVSICEYVVIPQAIEEVIKLCETLLKKDNPMIKGLAKNILNFGAGNTARSDGGGFKKKRCLGDNFGKIISTQQPCSEYRTNFAIWHTIVGYTRYKIFCVCKRVGWKYILSIATDSITLSIMPKWLEEEGFISKNEWGKFKVEHEFDEFEVTKKGVGEDGAILTARFGITKEKQTILKMIGTPHTRDGKYTIEYTRTKNGYRQTYVPIEQFRKYNKDTQELIPQIKELFEIYG